MRVEFLRLLLFMCSSVFVRMRAAIRVFFKCAWNYFIFCHEPLPGVFVRMRAASRVTVKGVCQGDPYVMKVN